MKATASCVFHILNTLNCTLSTSMTDLIPVDTIRHPISTVTRNSVVNLSPSCRHRLHALLLPCRNCGGRRHQINTCSSACNSEHSWWHGEFPREDSRGFSQALQHNKLNGLNCSTRVGGSETRDARRTQKPWLVVPSQEQPRPL